MLLGAKRHLRRAVFGQPFAADLDAARGVAQRNHTAAASGHALDCQLSIGVTTWHGPGDTLDAMLARADKALYQAKAQGRNQTCTA